MDTNRNTLQISSLVGYPPLRNKTWPWLSEPANSVTAALHRIFKLYVQQKRVRKPHLNRNPAHWVCRQQMKTVYVRPLSPSAAQQMWKLSHPFQTPFWGFSVPVERLASSLIKLPVVKQHKVRLPLITLL